MFKSSVSFVFSLALLLFVGGFAATIRNGGEPSESQKLDLANESISGLAAQHEEMRDKVQYFADQLEIISDRQSDSAESNRKKWEEWEKFAETQEAKVAEVINEQNEVSKGLERLADGQKEFAGRAGEKLDVLAERFDFGDARMREIAAAQEDFAALGEKMRTSTAFKKVATAELDKIGRALSERIQLAMKNRQKLTDDHQQKVTLLKERRSQLQQLTNDHESNSNPQSGGHKKRILDEAEKILVATYRNEIAELEREVGDFGIKTPASFHGIEKALQLVLARAEEEYAVVFTYHDPEVSVIDLTSKLIEMIRQLPDDDPILSDL